MTASAPVRMPLSNSTGTSGGTALDDVGQRVERGDRAVDLATAVVGDDHAVDAGVERAARVVGGAGRP